LLARKKANGFEGSRITTGRQENIGQEEDRREHKRTAEYWMRDSKIFEEGRKNN
jgi:hypothetical protein